MDQKPQNYWQPETDTPPSTEAPAPSPRVVTPPSGQTPTLPEAAQPATASAQSDSDNPINGRFSAPDTTPEPGSMLESNDDDFTLQPQPDDGNVLLAWRASEYIHHDKGIVWYLVLGGITIGAAALAFVFQQWLFGTLIVVMGITMTIFAHRPPREITYELSLEGIRVEDRLFPYNQFRSFTVEKEGAFYSLQLRPIKRFSMGVTIYFAESEGEQIVDILAARMPMEESKPDIVDQFMRWLRF